MARAYPRVRVDGLDLDEASVGLARRNLAGSGVEDRVRFVLGDAASPLLPVGGYDLVTVFEALHDMSDPVGVLTAARALLASGGSVIVADERSRTPSGDAAGFERFDVLPSASTA